MKHNFDEIVDRRNTNSIKYDFTLERGKPEDTLPLWVADMDFRTDPAVTEALMKAVQHGIYGYSESKQRYFDAIYRWYKERFLWEIRKEWIVKTPGVVFAITTAIRSLSKKGDAVMVQRPVYYPFFEAVKANHRSLINNPLIYKNGKYYIDFEDFEAKIMKYNVKLFILCSPHNPVGRVWTKKELTRVGEICLKHNVIVVSDEIHADFTYQGYEHYVFANLSEEFSNNSVICTAPSKTFNLAGLQVSNIVIKNDEIRHKYHEELKRGGYSELNTMGLIACQAAYEHGAVWLDELRHYLSENLKFIRSFLAERLPEIKLVEPQGTYLVWLDFSALNLGEEELEELIVHKANLWLNRGTTFGCEGMGFQRINIACPRAILEKAFQQLEHAVSH